MGGSQVRLSCQAGVIEVYCISFVLLRLFLFQAAPSLRAGRISMIPAGYPCKAHLGEFGETNFGHVDFSSSPPPRWIMNI